MENASSTGDGHEAGLAEAGETRIKKSAFCLVSATMTFAYLTHAGLRCKEKLPYCIPWSSDPPCLSKVKV